MRKLSSFTCFGRAHASRMCLAIILLNPASTLADMSIAEPVICHDPMIVVKGTSVPVAEEVCTSAMAAKVHLGQCGLEQQRPVTIEITDKISGPAEHCAGLYLCGSDRVFLIPPNTVDEFMPAESIFARIPSAAYYSSLIVHELAHALMDQTEFTKKHSDADREYVAYAMQVSSMSPNDRHRFEGFREIENPVDVARLNGFILSLKPDIFAAYAWAHFDESANGCAFVADVIEGRVSLALPDLIE